MSIAVAVFGTSRSGKDSTINDAIEILSEKGMHFTHISPTIMLQKELNGRKLRQISEEEKHSVIDIVRHNLYGLFPDNNVFVDEHFSFPLKYDGKTIDNEYYGEKLPSFKRGRRADRLYDVVFKDEWIEKYDVVVYLEINPKIILKRFRTSIGDKNNPFITSEDIRQWQLFELERIQTICNDRKVPLFYIYDHEKSGKEMDVIMSHYLKHNRNHIDNQRK